LATFILAIGDLRGVENFQERKRSGRLKREREVDDGEM
jgi:hypothetical protein